MSRKSRRAKSPSNGEQSKNNLQRQLNDAIRFLIDLQKDPLKTRRLKGHHIRNGAECEIPQQMLPMVLNQLKARGILSVEIENNNRSLYRIDELPAEDALPIGVQTTLSRFNRGGDGD